MTPATTPIYLDHAATTPMRPGVWEAMEPFTGDVFGNSSGVHETSRRAKNALESAREQIAALIGAAPMEVVFTSGGTESDNLALKGAVYNRSDRNGVTTVVSEHEAVLETADFLERTGHPVSLGTVDRQGRVDPSELASLVTDRAAVVSVMLVNNETGVIQDVASVSEVVKSRDPEVYVHTDAVQAFGCLDVDVEALGVDMMSITGHKFGGPKGVGMLYVREGVALEPIVHGGGQELGRRSGTHDVAGVVGLAKAMQSAVDDRARFRDEIGGIRDHFESILLSSVEGLAPNTPRSDRSSHHLNVRIPGVRNETLLMRLDQAGVAASAGSACQSGAATVSHVLEGMGMTADEARQSVRFTFGWTSTIEEADRAADIVADLVGALR